jgi:hypothetical protein
MAITQFTRFKSDKHEEMIKTAKQAKAIFEKHGAEFLRLSRAIPVGKRTARRRRQWQRTRHSRSCGHIQLRLPN